MAQKSGNTQKPRRKKRRWLLRLVILLLLTVIVFLGAAPALLSTRFASKLLVDMVNGKSETKIELEQLSLSWRGPMSVRGLTAWDKQGRESLKLAKATLVRNIWEVVQSPGDFGELIVEGVQVTTYPAAAAEEAVWPIAWSGPQPRGHFVIQGGRLQRVSSQGGMENLFDIEGDFTIDTFNDIQGELLLSIDAGKVRTEIILRDFNATGQLNPETVTGEVKITTPEKLDLKKLLNLAQVQADISGLVQLNLQADYQSGRLSTEIHTEFSGLQDDRAAALGTPPLDVSFAGQMEIIEQRLTGSGDFNSTAGTLRTEFSYPLAQSFTEIINNDFLDIILKGSVVELPEFSLEVAGSLDLPVLSRAIPSLLQVRDDIRITQGTLHIDKFTGQGGTAPQFAGSVQLADLAAAQDDKLLAFEPITVDYDLRLESGIGLHIHQSEIKSEFARLSARGTFSHITGDFTADLSRLHRQMAEILILNKPYPDNIAGRWAWSGACRLTGGMVSLTGRGHIDDFQIGSGTTAFREQHIELIHDVEMDREEQTIRLKQSRLSSSILSAQIEGTVRDYKTVALLDLQGNYEGSWEKITQVLHDFFPQTIAVVDIKGISGSDFQITGAARREDLQPTFYDIKSKVPVKWDSARLYGVQLGPAEFFPQLNQAQILLPLTSIAAQNGKFHIQGVVDLRHPELVWRISEPVMILDNFPVDQETGNQLLSYVNPIFAQMARMSGLASLELGDVEIPLSENYQSNIKAHGLLSLADMQVQTEGMLAAIELLLGLRKQVTQPMKVEKAQFDIKNGRIYYDDFRVTIARVYDLKFYGSVGFDDSLDLTVSLPVVPDLLENLGIQNPVKEFTKLITGARLEIPIVGTRTKPVLDMSAVDLTPLLQQTAELPIKGAQTIIENIFKIIKTP